MTLQEWAALQPVALQRYAPTIWYIPDSALLKCRSAAWWLTDARVTSVAGGTIWFRIGLTREKRSDA